MRSLYRQNRNAELQHGRLPPPPKGEDLYSDPDAAPPADSQGRVAPPQPATTQPVTAQPAKD
jgi:hypothetical protein